MWQQLRSIFPSRFQSFCVRLVLVLVLLTLTRIVFFVNNSGSFSGVGIHEWLVGVWFDAVTLGLVLIPFFAFSLIPFPFSNHFIYRLLQKICFHVPVLLIIALNLLDTEYYSFTHKRSTADLLVIVSAGNDIQQLLTSFIRDFWFVIICFIVLFIGLEWMYRKTQPERFETNKRITWKRELLFFVVSLPLFVIMGRGGLAIHKPLSIIDATLYTAPQNSALVLNSAFTMLKSYGAADLEEKKYMSLKVEQQLFNPIQTTQPQGIFPDKTNVMIIMLESFGNEWVGAFNQSQEQSGVRTSYTPFFDSLIGESLTFEYGFSNGKKSIEGVPAINGSLPTLMDNPYISSAYGNNTIRALPQILKENNYSTAFFHGATNGSMRFNSFSKQLGFEQYIGRFEYNNDAHFDKTWGILDEYFNPWTAKQLTKMKAPFCATLFTLSSHHPYYIPPRWRKKVKKGPNPICASINYGDISLRKFFEQAKKEPWYENTIFVLVADHTSSTNSPYFSQLTKMYQIPIVFFDPKGRLPIRREQTIFQQLDIMPTVLDLLNIKTKYYAFGQSYFSKQPRFGLAYIEGTHHFFSGKNLLSFSNDKAISLTDFTRKQIGEPNLLTTQKATAKKMEKQLQAIIQRYNRDLINNQTRVK